LLASLLASCTHTEPTLPNFGQPETEGREACDNLDESLCVFPFPSDRFRRVENGQGSLDFGDEGLPAGTTGESMSTEHLRRADGFSVITPIYFTLPEAQLAGAPREDHLEESLKAASRTLVIDTVTGELMPHWAEFDPFSLDGGKPTIALRLARKLEFGRRYVVAVHGLVDATGQSVPATRGFAALRDRKASVVRGVDARRERFEQEVFPVIAKAGVERAQLQLAFDFTTATEANVTGTLLQMRDLMLAAVGEEGPEYTITAVDEINDAYTARIVRGVAKIPSFLDGTEGTLRRLRRDANGQLKIEGFEEVPFDVYIPRSVAEGSAVVPLVQYGHGFLGRKAEANNEWLRKMAHEKGFMVIAANMQGMSETDEQLWGTTLLGAPSNVPLLSEKPHQGLINHLALVRMMKGRFAKDTDARYTRSGAALYDPKKIYYYGNSQGGTLGGVMMSVQTDITRGVLGVPGGAFALLLTRSIDFTEFADVIKTSFPDAREFLALLGVMQSGFDRVDSISYEGRMTKEPFPNTPSHRVLVHVAKEDAQVSNSISFLVGRTVGAKLLQPAVRPVFGLESVTSSYEGNVVVEVDFGWPANPRPNYPPPKEHDTHGELRKNGTAQTQMWHFLSTGEVKHFCDDVCNPD
jgi:hypothetical protein